MSGPASSFSGLAAVRSKKVDGLEKALRFFGAHDSFILTTHEGSDADGIGAEVLLSKVLRSLDKKVRVVNSEPVQPRFTFLDTENMIEPWNPVDHRSLANGSALVVLDSDEMNLGAAGEELIAKAADVFIIDHHESLKRGRAEGYIDAAASSTSELAFNIAFGLGVSIDPASARAAFAGIVYDTGSFMYPKTSERTFRVAEKLVSAGAVPNEVHRALHENSSMGALLLQKRVLSTLGLRENGRIALQTMLRSDILETGAHYEDAEPFINIPLHCKDVEISILFKENEEGLLRCSLRSKGAVDVSLIAQDFGGGGHRTAAGFKCKEGLAEAGEEVLQKVSAALRASEPGE